MSPARTAPYGSWPSPIDAADVARTSLHFDTVAFGSDGAVWWDEPRPADNGRVTVVRRAPDGTVRDRLPSPYGARTRVHEYGGGAWTLVGETLVFANWTDQRLYRLDEGADDPLPLTPEPATPQGDRYAALLAAAGRGEVWCVRERETTEGAVRELVAVPLDGSAGQDAGAVRVLRRDGHFLAHPTLSPDGRHLAWLTWDHPLMPWDGTRLRVAAVRADGTLAEPTTLLGGPDESVFQPEWADSGRLYAVSDRTGWWNLYALDVDGGTPRALHRAEQEFGVPQWTLGMRTYALLGDGRLAVLHGSASWRLGVLDPATGALADLPLPYTAWRPSIAARGGSVVAVAGSATTPDSVVLVDVATETASVLRQAGETPPAGYLPQGEPVAVPGPGGRTVHATVYPPANPDVLAPDGELPPYVLFVHGGPTDKAWGGLRLVRAYFTSRGIGVAEVDYSGSASYGRAYRERLRGAWGVADVEDCVAVARALAAEGIADPARIGIRGGSAGGWTTLVALTSSQVFAAGTSLFGVADLRTFAVDTHDFESRYLDGLVGPLPAAENLYRERSPLSRLDGLSCPVLLLQGSEDRIVPPSQAEMFAAALRERDIPHAYLLFEGEQHGFRRAQNVIAALEAELSFYGQVLGFDPPGVPRLALATGRRTA
jgi:dipeptidyl aminopeptidase/acylaminoacyl peptidase